MAGNIQPGNANGTEVIQQLSAAAEEEQVFFCSASNICGNVSSTLILHVQGMHFGLILIS